MDLFAGAGGWEEGLHQLGHGAIGIEHDPDACATATAAGHARLRADVAALDPEQLGEVWGLIASPPCQAYSAAGKRLGRHDKPHVIACAHEIAAGHDTRHKHATACRDPRSLLTVEPLRYAVALRPKWIALEQVPPVLELWTLFATLLAAHAYQSAVGVLSAERYGVPQTGKRAFLIASFDGPVQLPEPTHRSFDPRRPDRRPANEERLLPWVSMATALDWSCPAVTYTNCQTSSGRRPRGLVRATDKPARTVDTSCGSWTIEPGTTTSSTCGLNARQRGCKTRALRRPAPTLTGQGLAKGTAIWACHHPATRMCSDASIQRRHTRNGPFGRDHRRGEQATRITVRQAGILQGFRADYPWHGSRGQQFMQVGNAVCPPVAHAVLTQAIAPSNRGRA